MLTRVGGMLAVAVFLVWALGLTLALRGGWFGAGWLSLKLGFVLTLSALHGVQSGALRRMAGGGEPGASGAARLAPRLIVGAVAAIVLLVVVKPF